MRCLKLAVTFAGAVAATTLARSAKAEPSHIGIDWGRLLLDLDGYARGRAERPTASTGSPVVTTERLAQPLVQNEGNAWFGVAPSVSFVARDWGSSYRLAGDRISLVDRLRLSESTRMVVSRVRLSNSSRVTPFAQVGVGQWRTDTSILPLTPRATEIAAQVGAGVELQLSSNWQVACETGGTIFIRDARESDNMPETSLWSAMVASRIVF